MKWSVIIVSTIIFFNCSKPFNIPDDLPLEYNIPSGFPEVTFPKGSEPTLLRAQLGRIFFYDKRLSANQEVSCGTCHALSAAFTDGKNLPIGLSGIPGKRNVPTLTNVGYQPYLLFEGGVPTLETQALVPLHDSLEMGMNMMNAVAKLNEDEYLRALTKKAYQRDSIDPWVVTRSLAIFQRMFISGDSSFDRYKRGQKDAMSEAAIRGMNLFFSDRTQCGSCHGGTFFTDYAFYDIGIHSMDDAGRFRVTHQPADSGKFKTPTLRNIAITSPYMHDGSIKSLDDVLAYYNRGGDDSPRKDPRIRELNLSEIELAELKEFLDGLTDWNFVQDERLLPLIQ